MNSIIPANTATYTTPKDWEPWQTEFRKRAEASDIWQFIDPDEDLDWPEKPIKPIYQDYPKKLQRRETRHNTPGTNNASSQPMVTGIHQPDEIDPNGRPNSVAEMTKEGRDNYRQNWERKMPSLSTVPLSINLLLCLPRPRATWVRATFRSGCPSQGSNRQ